MFYGLTGFIMCSLFGIFTSFVPCFEFINNDGQSITIITCAPKESDIYKKLDIVHLFLIISLN